MSEKRVVYLDDYSKGDELTAPAFINGFTKEGIEPKVYCNFDDLEVERELAEAYFIPHELSVEPQGGRTGTEMALKLYQKAQELGKELIIVVFCPDPALVENQFATQLKEKNILVFNEKVQRAISFFYVARWLEERVGFNEWLEAEGISSLPEENEATEAIQKAILWEMLGEGTKGCSFWRPVELIQSSFIEDGLTSETLQEMRRIFGFSGQSSRGKEGRF